MEAEYAILLTFNANTSLGAYGYKKWKQMDKNRENIINRIAKNAMSIN